MKNWYQFPIVYFGLTKKLHVIIEIKNGLKLKLRVNSTDLMAFTHVWIIKEYSRKGFEIKENDTIIEIGAHIGLFSVYASQFCENGKVYCYEPVKNNYDVLLSNLQLNNIKNVIPFNLAVSDSESTAKMFLSYDESGHSLYLPTDTIVQVNSTTLKKIFDDNAIQRCDFIKMDCEGAEYDIVKSLPDEYFTRIEKMIIEYHFADTKPQLLDDLVKRLKSLSFHIEKEILFSDIGFLYVTKN
jgi:FkbM family methyltransferase